MRESSVRVAASCRLSSLAVLLAVTLAAACDGGAPPSCGDGVLDPPEECDDGNTLDTDACTSACVVASCGDGIVQFVASEECDDGNAEDGDACTTQCREAVCGDAIVRAGVEVCDDGNLADDDGCRNNCGSALCGDGVVQAGSEVCDDGNRVDTDLCTNACAASACGDGIVHPVLGEECDDGDASSGDGCSAVCRIEGPSTVLYTTGPGSDTIVRIDVASGEAMPIVRAESPGYEFIAALSRDERVLYYSYGGTELYAQPIAGGEPELIADMTSDGLALSLAKLAVAPDGVLYAVEGFPNVIRRFPGGGAPDERVHMPGSSFGIYGLAIAANGDVFYSGPSAGNSQIRVVTGLDSFELFAEVPGVTAIAFDGAGNLYAASNLDGRVRRVGGPTDVTVVADASGVVTSSFSMAIDRVSGRFYLASEVGGTIWSCDALGFPIAPTPLVSWGAGNIRWMALGHQ